MKPGTSALVESDEQQVDALVAEPREAGQVGEPTVERCLVHLEVAGVQHGVPTHPDRHRQGVRDRMVDGEELQLPLAKRHRLGLTHLAQIGLAHAVLAEFGRYQRESQP